jgi:translation initiation factor IF-2
MGRIRIRSKNNIKIVDLLQELNLSEGEFYRILKEINIRLVEGQKNLDQQEVASVRRYLKEKQRRAELRSQTIGIPPIIKVQELAKKLELPIGEILAMLLKNGVMATLNDDVDYDTAAIIASDLGYNTEEVVEELEKDLLTPEKLEEILKKEDPKEQEDRPPVVTIMGHVDHGKTTLLDSIRAANVAKGEAGGITQAISGYQVEHKGRTITFIDTPGHATFEFMRKRGASLADVAILVVAADDGVKPQTKEAVKHAKAAGVPIVVAINKTDKEGVNLEKVKTELSEIDLQPEEYGGKTVVVPISALKKKGIDELLEMVLLTTDITPPKAVQERAALGSVIESHLDTNLGPLATVLIHTGTLATGDNVVIGKTAGRVRRMTDFQGKQISKARPSMPVTVVGLSAVPNAGDIVQVVEETSEARSKAESRRAPVKKLSSGTDENDERKTLALVIIADSQGSLEALQQTVEAMIPKEVRLSIIRAEVGTVTDSDVLTAAAAGAIIYAFSTNVSGMSRKLAEKEGVEIKTYDVIYHLSEDVRAEIEKRLPVETVHTDIGKLKVLKVFFSTPKSKIVGGEVAQGKITKGAQVIIRRPSAVDPKIDKNEESNKGKIGEGEIVEMQREKTAIKEAQKGDQIGITIEGKGKIKEGDVLDIFTVEEVRKPLDS